MAFADHWPDVRQRLIVVVGICAAMVAVHVAGWGVPALRELGIHPRNVSSAWMIATAPFVHGDVAHLGNNLVVFVILAGMATLRGIRHFLLASLIIILLGGGLVWLFGRNAIHMGASGWIFGLWSLAIVDAWFDRSPRAVAVSVAVIFFYGGMLSGVLPTQADISFESHLFGAIAGIVAALLLRRPSTPASVSDGHLPPFWSRVA